MLNVLTNSAPSAHQIQRQGIGYSRGLTNDELHRIAPSIFAAEKHESRSARYAYVPTADLLDGMRDNGFFPVKVTHPMCRTEDKKNFGKHLIRFRREDQLQSNEAREIILVNSHDGSSSFQLMAGVFRLVCSNGLIVGKNDTEIRIPHSGRAIDNVIEGSFRVINEFDQVTESIETMKSIVLPEPLQIAFAEAAMEIRFDDAENSGVKPSQLLRPHRLADKGADLWTTFNVIQENAIRGGLRTLKRDERNQIQRGSTREIKGIDQNVKINKALWIIAEAIAKQAA